jgi:leucyl-tRNA synthetase
VEREAITAIVKHWSEDKYICLKWKKVAWGTFITGGVEKGQTPEEAAMAEIMEETGYRHPILKRILSRTHSKFFHIPKNENRFAHFHNLYFELKDGDKAAVSEDEQAKHEVRWLTKDEVPKFLTAEGHRFSWNEFVGNFNGMESGEAKKKITEFVGGKMVTTYKLRDWIFSRQRYWGEPLPLIFCENCGQQVKSGKLKVESDGERLNPGWFAVSGKNLPVKLPKVKNYKPTDTGESPLSSISKWVNVKCPKCGGKARRETDTMPNWAGSSWYYLRYVDPKNKKEFVGKKKLDYWCGISPKLQTTDYKLQTAPVDWYNGGMEHTTLHLLYSRFWHKFLFDLGVVPTLEPYLKRTSHGIVLAEGGVKMSKSKPETIINPDDIVKTFGADTLRLYEMFMGPFDQKIAWSKESIIGPRRFLEKVWRLQEKLTTNNKQLTTKKSQPATGSESSKLDLLLNQTIKKVSDDIDAMRFNTAVSALMVLVNEMERAETISKEQYGTFLKLLAPFAPHIAEELWSIMGGKKSISLEPWPTPDASTRNSGPKKFVIQINGKVRAVFETADDLTEEQFKEKALSLPEIKKWVEGKSIKKTICILKNRLLSIVV